MGIKVGWAELDAQSPPFGVNVGWAEFDVQGVSAPLTDVRIGWAEFDVAFVDAVAAPIVLSGGGFGHTSPGNYNRKTRRYDIPIDLHSEDDEELVVIHILMEIARNEFF